MGFVVAAIVVVLLVGGFVIYLVLNTSRKSGAPATDDDAPGIGTDPSPLGDTTEHGDAEGSGRFERETTPPYSGDAEATAHRARPGEGEGETQLRFTPERPASQRLSDRYR